MLRSVQLLFGYFSMHFQQNNRIVTVFENGYLGRWRLQQQNETSLVVFRLWRKSKDAGDLFCTFSSLSPRPIIRDPNNRKLRGPIMILKCTTTQDWHFGRAAEMNRFWAGATNQFLQILVIMRWTLTPKFSTTELQFARFAVRKKLSKHLEFREKWWQGNYALDYPQ